MSFINRYTKNKTFQFVYSEEFTERNTSVVFAIGSYNSLGLISKIDTNGNVIWEKTYQIKAEKEALQFKQIIKIGNENIEKENKYVVYASSKTNKYLLCFNSLDGSINWANLLLWEDVDVVFKMKKSESDSGFYISISDRNEIDTNKNPTLALFDSDGKFILGNKLYNPNEELIINNIDTDKGGVTAVGRYIEKDSVGVISRLNTDLKINYSIGIVEPYNTIHDIKTLEGNQFLISGYNNQEDGIYVSLINSQGENLLYNFPDSKNHRSELQIGNSGFYILISDSRNGYLYKLDWKFKIIWAKTIKLESENNNIRNFCFNKYF